MKWYLQVLKNYTNFNGRSRRTEYWMFALFNCLFLFLASILDKILGTNFDTIFGIHLKVESQPISLHILPLGYIYLIYALVVIIPSLSVSVRRLHDVGKSGWMLLIGLIPILGAIYLLILLVTDSNLAPNQYGDSPKGFVAI
jgi:uncharacterized membrane protein YhaH (DUF805 family)